MTCEEDLIEIGTKSITNYSELSHGINMTEVSSCSLFPKSLYHSNSEAFDTVEAHEMSQEMRNSHQNHHQLMQHEIASGPETHIISNFGGTRDISHPGSTVNIERNNERDSNCVNTLITIVQNEEIGNDPHSPLQVDTKVKMVVQKWGPVAPINPERFFLKMLLSRGYSSNMIPALTSQYRRNPSPKQIQDYDNELVHAIKNGDLPKIKYLHQSGTSMSACNKYSESVVHMACRRGSFEVADFILSNGGDCSIIDDYGRTPLHDACWRMEPRFDVVTLLLDRNIDLLKTLDVRGSTPLKYVREEHWIQWCAYIFYQKEKYWRPIGDPTENNKRLRCF